MTRKLDIITAWTLVVAIVFTGLAHGAVEPWSAVALELLIVLMLELWSLKMVAQRRLNIIVPAPVYPLLGLLVVGIMQAVSWTAADGSRGSLSFDVEVTRGAIFLLALMIVAMLVAANFWTSRSRLKAFAVFITAFGFAFAVFALIQGLTWNGRFFWIRPLVNVMSPYGPFPSHNNYAGYIELFIPIPLAIALSRTVSAPARLFSAFAAVVMSLSVIFSLSRGGMISLAAGLLFLGAAALQSARQRRRVWEAERWEDEGEFEDDDARDAAPIWRRAPYPQVAIALAIVLAIVGGMIWLGPDKIASRLTQGTLSGEEGGGQNFYSSRGWIWSDTWRMIKANPVTGVGLGAYATAFPIYTVSDGSIRASHAHNDYLQILADGGVIAGLLGIWFIVTVLRAVMQGLTSRDPWHGIFALGGGAAIFSLAVHSLFDFNLQIPSTALLFLVLVGIVGGIAEVRKRRELDSRAQRHAGVKKLAERRREPAKVAAALFSGGRFDLRGPNVLSRTEMKMNSLKTRLAMLLIVSLIAGSASPLRAQFPQKPSIQPQLQTKPPETKSPETTIKDTSKEVISNRANILTTGDEDYVIGAGDSLDIRVADAEELSGSFRVRADGTIKMHFLGRIVALDKTTEALAKDIADGLRGKYLFEPRVSVNVTELTSKSIYLQGAIAKPGVYQIEGRPHLLQALVQAGGLLPNHAATAFIIRRTKVSEEDIKAHEAALKEANAKAREQEKIAAAKAAAEKAAAAKAAGGTAPVEKTGVEKAGVESAGAGSVDETGKPQTDSDPKLIDAEWLAKQYTLVKLNINGLFKGSFEQNMFLQPGDIVTVPNTDLYFVSGQVKAPGSFPLKEGTTLRQALALSQGFTNTSSPGKGIIFRENPETGKRREIPVDMGKVMDGKAEDVALYANDIVLIPNSTFKQIALPLINAAVYSVMTALLFKAIDY